MSRRITFVALAASATLIATQAAADPACFEASCRGQEAAEPPAAQPLSQAEIAPPQISPSQRHEGVLVRRDEPPIPVPQYAERPQPPAPVMAPVRPTRTVPAAAARAAAVVAVPAPDYVAPQRPVVNYVARQAPSTASAAIIEVPGEIQTGDGLVTVYPNLRPDPAWKLCQIDSRDLGHRSYRCTAYSYHPYGEGGYRPFGTYRNYPTSPGYVLAPSAKIISINPND